MLMRKLLAASAMSLVMAVAANSAAQAADGEACKKVRIAEAGGWTDNTATNGLFTTVLKGLGYEATVDLLALPVILESLKNKDLDVFLDNWMPSQTAEMKPYMEDKSVDSIGANLEGAGYGPVVPQYAADAGVKDVKDLGKFTEKFEGKFYGIEPGNDGNRIVQAKIDDPANGLDGWEMVESSEQGMLVQAQKAISKNEFVAFLAWTPHPIMGKMPLHYLSGFEADGFGGATIYTLSRAGYSAECPNVGALLKNLKFSLDQESALMEAILGGKDGETAGTEWLKANPGVLDAWLAGVTTFDGKEGLAAVKASLGL